MPRRILEESRIHPSIRGRVGDYRRDILDEVEAAVGREDIVVVGMAMNPFVRKARRLLDSAGVRHTYLEYGSYLSDWRRRNALKMWTGWPTLPMVFVKGTLIGGAADLERLVANGELNALRGTDRSE